MGRLERVGQPSKTPLPGCDEGGLAVHHLRHAPPRHRTPHRCTGGPGTRRTRGPKYSAGSDDSSRTDPSRLGSRSRSRGHASQGPIRSTSVSPRASSGAPRARLPAPCVPHQCRASNESLVVDHQRNPGRHDRASVLGCPLRRNKPLPHRHGEAGQAAGRRGDRLTVPAPMTHCDRDLGRARLHGRDTGHLLADTAGSSGRAQQAGDP